MLCMEGDDENELSFVSLAALTANVTRYLRLDEKKDEQRDREDRNADKGDDRQLEHRRFVEQRIREIGRFENVYRAGRHRRK